MRTIGPGVRVDGPYGQVPERLVVELGKAALARAARRAKWAGVGEIVAELGSESRTVTRLVHNGLFFTAKLRALHSGTTKKKWMIRKGELDDVKASLRKVPPETPQRWVALLRQHHRDHRNKYPKAWYVHTKPRDGTQGGRHDFFD